MLSWWYLLCFSISCWFRTKLSQAKVLSCAVPDCRSSDGSPSKATWWPGGAWLRVLPLRRVVVDWMGSKTVAWLTSRETLIEQRRRPPRVLFGMKLSWACGHETRGRGSVRKRSRNKLIIRPRPTNPMSSLINDFFSKKPRGSRINLAIIARPVGVENSTRVFVSAHLYLIVTRHAHPSIVNQSFFSRCSAFLNQIV